MRIDRINKISDIYNAQSMAPIQKNKPVQKDEATFSAKALDIQNAYKAAKAAPDVRTSKVEDIKEQIKSGTYTVDAKELSQKIISKLDIRG